jgi:uncharacterized protein YjgD (DUF1641 family)
MAQRLEYRKPKPAPAERARCAAYDELDALVIALHEHGVLRLLRDLVGSASTLSLLPAREMDNERGYDSLANLYILASLAGRVPAGELKSAAEAIGDGFAAMGRTPPDDEPYPPGLTGTYEMLKDDELWQGLGPVLEGVKAFTRELQDSRGQKSEADDKS